VEIVAILSLYIFTDTGLPLITRYFGRENKNIEGLVTPFLVITSLRFKEITGEPLTEVTLGNKMTLFIVEFANILGSILVQGSDDYQMELDHLIRSFYKKYIRLLDPRKLQTNISFYDNFDKEIQKILPIDTEITYITLPNKALDTLTLAEYPQIKDMLKKIIVSNEISFSKTSEIIQNHEMNPQIKKLIDERRLGIKFVKTSQEHFYFIL
jgi:hypothetical protein